MERVNYYVLDKFYLIVKVLWISYSLMLWGRV